MKITIVDGLLSIGTMEWNDVPSLAVLTGKNGAGKTQLLRSLASGITQSPYGAVPRKRDQKLPKVTIEGFTVGKSDLIFQQAWNSSLGGTSDVLKHTEQLRALHKEIVVPNSRHEKLSSILRSKSKIPLIELTFEEFVELLPDEYSVYGTTTTIGQAHLPHAVNHYRLKRLQLLDEGRDPVSELGIPPWEVVNDVFKVAQFPYRLAPPASGSSLHVPFVVQLIDERNGQSVEVGDLSSGEQVILGIALLLYRSNYVSALPKLMLLDEPDAHLHPGMSKQLIDVLADVIVNRLGVRVIMTTHSPSTIAFVPEESIYVMQKVDPRIRKCSKDEAIRELTSGLIVVGPNLKYAFVEADEDVRFFQMVLDVMRSLGLGPIRDLTFIPVSKDGGGGGGADQVRSWTGKLRTAVDDRFVGVIDRDVTNIAKDGVKVLSRYSIENYLLDPLVVYALWLEASQAPVVHGLTISIGDESGFRIMSQVQLQSIVDAVVAEISALCVGYDFSTVDIEYTNGIVLKYPHWLVNERGKDLLVKFQGLKLGPKNFNCKELLTCYRRVRMVPKELADILIELERL